MPVDTRRTEGQSLEPEDIEPALRGALGTLDDCGGFSGQAAPHLGRDFMLGTCVEEKRSWWGWNGRAARVQRIATQRRPAHIHALPEEYADASANLFRAHGRYAADERDGCQDRASCAMTRSRSRMPATSKTGRPLP